MKGVCPEQQQEQQEQYPHGVQKLVVVVDDSSETDRQMKLMKQMKLVNLKIAA